MRKKRQYLYVTEEQIRQAVMELEREENMDLEQEIAEANAWAEENHIVRPPFPVPADRKKPSALMPRRDAEAKPKRRNRLKPCIQLAAVLVIVLLGGWYTQSDAVQGLRLDLVNLFTKTEIDRGILTLEGQSEWSSHYIPEYIPEGLELERSYKSLTQRKYTQIFKSNTGNSITIIQSLENVIYTYLDKNNSSEITVQSKYRAQLYFQNDMWFITWYDDHNIFVMVNGSISIQEGLKFVDNLKWSQQ